MTLERATELLHELLAQSDEDTPLNRTAGLLTQKLLSESSDGSLAHADSQTLAESALREWQRASARATKRPLMLQFYSMSKDADDMHIGQPSWRKKLSNFCEVVPGLIADGSSYRTVEHYFQAAKYTLAGRPERARAFETGGAVGNAPLAAKKAGARKAFEAAGCTLDIQAWGAMSDGVMWHALLSRACADLDFCAILLEAHAQGVSLLHFERQGAQSYWGGSVNKSTGAPQGRNRLGEMMLRLAALLACEGGADAIRARYTPEKPRTPEERLANWTAMAAVLVASEEAHAPGAELEPTESDADNEERVKRAKSTL